MHVIPEANYTLDASEGTITLVSPYDSLELSQLVTILDLNTSDILYDVSIKREGVTLSGAVITYTTDSNVVLDTDKLRIVIDDILGNDIIASTVGDGRKTVASAGTAEALAASTAIKEVTVTAELDNTDVVVVGGSTVVAALGTRRGTPLFPGDSTTLMSDNLAEVFIDSVVNGEGVTYQYIA